MKLFIYSLMILCLPCCFAYAQEGTKTEAFKSVKAESKLNAKWWKNRHEKKLAALKKQDKVDLLMIGDSITHGWEGGGKKVWQKYYAKRNAFNIGYSGDRT